MKRAAIQGGPSAALEAPSSGATVTGIVKPKGLNALTAASAGAAAALQVTVTVIEASVRIKVDNTTEIEGDVTGVSRTCPSLSLVVHGWTVNMNATSQGSCGDVRVGIRIKIKGHRSGTVIVVVKVEVQLPL